MRPLSSWRRLQRLAGIAALLTAMIFVLDPARQAVAHASLLSAEPADGITLTVPPKTFRLDFNEPVSPLVMRLVRPNGAVATLTNVTATNNSVVIASPPMPQQGSYVLSWRVISADGHPVGGVVSFALGHPSSGVSAPPVLGAVTVHAAIWCALFLLFVGVFIGTGGAATYAWLRPERSPPGRNVLAAIMVAGIVGAIISLPLQGLDALAQPLADVWQSTVWA